MSPKIHVLAALLFFSGSTLATDLRIEADIDRHARAWLVPIDNRDPDAAWESSSELMRSTVPKSDWEKALRPIAAFGTVNRRTPTSVTFSVKLPGAPDGQYVVINYDTAFTGKEKTVESVILRREADGLWRGVGYRVQ
jgi:hypothetical protein